MLFNSLTFVFLFLPVSLALVLVLPRQLRNAALVAVSLVFCAWGSVTFLAVVLASTAVNYALGLVIDRSAPRRRPAWLAAGITCNVAALVGFKYLGFLVENVNIVLRSIGAEALPAFKALLPFGISFLTFKAISYLVTVSRGQATARRNPVDVALYLALYPAVMAGPIDAWATFAPQLSGRVTTLDRFASGVRRFCLGLVKKVVVSAPLGGVADQIFGLPAGSQSPAVAWLGALAFTLQLYYDFSGYTDMAIGLGRMLGFELTENFNFPFLARSIGEFWRRWHMSLSSWLRDHLFLPLAYRVSRALPGERYAGVRSDVLTYASATMITFLLCGLWHGAAWTFVLWGAIHGVLLACERSRFGRWLHRRPEPVSRIYVLAALTTSFVVFRAPTLTLAASYLKAMIGISKSTTASPVLAAYLDREVVAVGALAILGATPVFEHIRRALERRATRLEPVASPFWHHAYQLAALACVALFLCTATLYLVAKTNTPFLYFRF